VNAYAFLATAGASTAWTGHDTRLVVCAAAGIAPVVLLTAALKIHPFPALIACSLLVAFTAAVPVDKILPAFENGVGSVLGDVGVIVALGAMRGKLLVGSDGADRLIGALTDRVGLPMFFETALVLLVPIIYLACRRIGGSILRVGIPALAGTRRIWIEAPPTAGPRSPSPNFPRLPTAPTHWGNRATPADVTDTQHPAGARAVISPYDPDARYGIEHGVGWERYKAQITEFCD
jgi:GntP family gluconate:H+ symporter